MPILSAPGGSSDSVEVESITVYAAVTAGFGNSGGGAAATQLAAWHASREFQDNEPYFLDIEYTPTPQNCADARAVLGQAQLRLNEYNALKNVFANEHVEFAAKLAAATAGIASSLGVGSSMVQVYNAALAAAQAARAAIFSVGGLPISLGLATVYAVLYIDRDRWETVVANAKADRDGLCGPGGPGGSA